MSARGLSKHVGDIASRTALGRLGQPYDLIADIPDDGDPDQLVHTKDGSLWKYDAASVLTADGVLVLGAATAGRWLRCAGMAQHLVVATAGFATADGATLLTIPSGCIVKPLKAWWNVTIAWTGGTSSAIGVDSDNTSLATPGDILGGGSGDLLADLTVGEARGTIGAAIDAPGAILEAGDLVRFQRIASAFTAGAATLRMWALIIANDGA